ncbi:MAG: PhzF family phenazine biosynthesis protein [Solirubrobacterales bacterium]
MADLHVLRVFANEEGDWGNPLGVFLDGGSVPESERQRVAAELGYSETVFLDDPERGALTIYTPAAEIPFAGHPLVGTAWLLARVGRPPALLRPAAGEVGVRIEGEGAFIDGRGDWSAFHAVELEGTAQVDELRGSPEGTGGDVYAWAWIDEAAGTVRARSFAPDFGIPEDEATGSAALGLAVQVGRELTIHQGRGSVLLARALGGGRGSVGGRVVLDAERDYPLNAG